LITSPYPAARPGATGVASAAASSMVKAPGVLSTTNAPGVPARVSLKLSSTSRGPYRAHPSKLAFDLGGYSGAATKGLWIDHLTWVVWGQPIAYASGIVHVRVWPSHNFMTTAGGIMLDELRSCATHS
jgi:hypothetical protein